MRSLSIYAGLAQPDAVFAWLQRAHAVRDVHLMFLTVDPKWDPYRADPKIYRTPVALWLHTRGQAASDRTLAGTQADESCAPPIHAATQHDPGHRVEPASR